MSRLITIFGGQFGSEGKGEIAALASRLYNVVAAVRIGGPNAGHTSYDDKERKVVVQSLPTPSALFGVDAWIGPEGCFIPDLLVKEAAAFCERNPGRELSIFIDECTSVITQEHMGAESLLKATIGSTGEGVGAVGAEKVMRKPDIIVRNYGDGWLQDLFKELPDVHVMTYNTYDQHINLALRTNLYTTPGFPGTRFSNPAILIEGTQGFGLSLHTSGYYPFCTSRECTPNALWAGTGINPLNTTQADTIMVIRTYPIRVGGPSGPMANEISWDDLNIQSGGYVKTPERTTVTKKIRRIAEIDLEQVRMASLQCRPSAIALTFLDYKFPRTAGLSWRELSKHIDLYREVHDYVEMIEDISGAPVCYVSTGPNTASITSRHPSYPIYKRS
jgi:adenylosuccinate synthase